MIHEESPWLTAAEAGAMARVSEKVIRRAVQQGSLKAAVVDRRGTLRIHRSWIHKWLEGLAGVRDYKAAAAGDEARE